MENFAEENPTQDAPTAQAASGATTPNATASPTDPALTDDDRIDEAGRESFPASDAPEGWAGKDVPPH